MKNLIISTFLILSTLATGLMSYQPGEITNLLGAVQASAQLKDTKRCDAATAGFYGEFVVSSANVSVVERDGKAGVPLPQNILLEAIKYSGLYRDMFLANTSAEKIIATAVAERACVISPVNYVSVVTMDASDKQYYSPTFLTYCGLGFTTIGNTFTKINGTQTADTLGYGAFLTSQCKPIPLVCTAGQVKVMRNNVEVCETPDVTCPANQYKPTPTGTCTPIVCTPPTTGTYPNCVTPPQVCPTTAPGTFPNCVVPPLVCTPPAVLNATKNGCDTTVTTVVCTPPAVINATKTACEIPATPVVCTAPAVLNPTTKVCETPAAPAEKKKGSILPFILGGVALLGGGLFLLNRNKKTPVENCVTNPAGAGCKITTTPCTPTTCPPPSVVTSTLVCPSNNSIVKNLTQESANGVMTRSTASLPAGTIIKVTQGTDAQVLAEFYRLQGRPVASSTNRTANRNVTLPTRTSNGTPTNFSKKTNVTVPTNANRTASTNANRLNSATVTNARVSGSNTNRTANVTTAKYSVICVTPRKPGTPPPATNVNSCPKPSNGGSATIANWLKSSNGKVTRKQYADFVKANESKIKAELKASSISTDITNCAITSEKAKG